MKNDYRAEIKRISGVKSLNEARDRGAAPDVGSYLETELEDALERSVDTNWENMVATVLDHLMDSLPPRGRDDHPKMPSGWEKKIDSALEQLAHVVARESSDSMLFSSVISAVQRTWVKLIMKSPAVKKAIEKAGDVIDQARHEERG